MRNLPWYVPDESDEKNGNDIDGAEIGKIYSRNINLGFGWLVIKCRKYENLYSDQPHICILK